MKMTNRLLSSEIYLQHGPVTAVTVVYTGSWHTKVVVGVLPKELDPMLYALHRSKAFDSLHPSLLVNKLRAYGFSEGSLILIRSYFAHQQNRMKLDSVASGQKESIRGCL